MSFDRLPLALALSLTILGGGLFLPTAAFGVGITEKNLPQTVAGYLTRTENLESPEESLKSLRSLDYPIYVAAKDDSSDKNSTASASGDTNTKSDPKADSKKDKAAKKAARDKEAQDLKDQKEAEKKKDSTSKSEDKKAAKADKDSEKDKTKEKKDKSAEAEVEKDKKKNKKDGGEKSSEHKSEAKPEAKSETKQAAKKDSKSESQAEAQAESKANLKADAKGTPEFVPDDALISVLKDVNRALADNQTEAVAKIENADQKMIIGLAQEIFSKALTEPNVNANRILPKDDEHEAKTQLTAESWSSGDVEVNDKLRGSMAAVWAKRIGGLVTVTIAGDAGQRKTADGKPIGEFMVVLTAHSPVQKGFDIQSQADVTFWIGKLNSITIEANCVPSEGDGEKVEASSNTDATSPSPSGSEAKKKSIVSLRPLLTNRYRNHYAVLLAADIQSQKELAALAAAADQDESDRMAAAGDERKAGSQAEEDAATAPVDPSESEKNLKAANKATGEKSQKSEKTVASSATNNGGTTRQAANNGEHSRVSVASNTGAAAAASIAGTPTAAAVIEGPHFNFPSASSTLLMPDKALAGQYVTVALLDRARQPEANVELSFNGASLTTDAAGQAVYQIPEDTTPGRTLNIALSARPDEIPSTLEVFQPLNITTGQAPRLDRLSPLAVKNSVMTVEGHNFDGLAHNNTVIIDGSQEGKIVSASPFQLKFVIPEGLTPGPHSLCISTDGMRSNLGGFDFADTQVTIDGKDNGKENAQIRLMIKVLGTSAKLNVKILNQTPDVVRLNRGAEMTATSSGGADNNVILPAVRGKKGPFKLDTQIEM